MSKLYVFGIGGTGARVLRSLTMLLAAGVECRMDIVPIIIDPDSSADSLTKAVNAMDVYNDVRSNLNYGGGGRHFFGTKIDQQVPRYYIPLQQTANKKFGDYINLATMSPSNQAMMHMLFSDDNLNSDMDVGFKGNPNIGSVVLNQMVTSREFVDFANSFQQGDQIFIISSIFGGTGASGFPLLLKTLRSNNDLPNFNLINNAPIGGITVLPYFSVTVDGNSRINSSDFIDKTKSALTYDDTNISGTNSIDRLYYIADTVTPTYNNSEGGASQNNDAHVVELFSALAVLDFANAQVVHDGTTVCYEYGVQNSTKSISFDDLGNVTKGQIVKPMTQFLLFYKYLRNACKGQYKYQPWAIDAEFDETFFSSGFEKSVEEMLVRYEGWLAELSKNTRSFAPFDLKKKDNIFKIVAGMEPQRSYLNGYALIDDALNAMSRPSGKAKEQWFVELFFKATEKVVKRKFNF